MFADVPGRDYRNGDMAYYPRANLSFCIDQCEAASDCLMVVYNIERCWLKVNNKRYWLEVYDVWHMCREASAWSLKPAA